MKPSLWSGSLLVAGTTIGGGMLALPVLTSLGGFGPSLVIYLFCWLFMAMTGLLLMELVLFYGAGSNLITLAEKTLGTPGKIVTWVLYLYLFYCLTIAYMVGCGNLMNSFFLNGSSNFLGTILFTALFAPIVWGGAKWVGPINSYMMVALMGLYLGFVFLGLPHINTELLNRKEWSLSLIALPIAFTSFAYQGIIPTLVTYLHSDEKKIRQSILLGSFIPLVTYAVWQGLILGIIPVEGPNGLKQALENGDNAIIPLKHFIGNPWVVLIGQGFAFFALLTSFFGVTLGLKDFLADGLKIEKTKLGRLYLSIFVFLPPLIFALAYPHVFLIALEYAGGYGCALLLGLLPILMVFQKRYIAHEMTFQQLRGGKTLLALLLLFVLFEIFIEIST